MDVRRESELRNLMNDFYGDDATVSQAAKDELLNYGRDLIRANQLEDYQDLMKVCAAVIADKGIDVFPARREVEAGRAIEKSDVPAPIQLMKDFEEQAYTELGDLTTGAPEVTQTREIVEKLAKVLSRQREIIEKIQRDPSSIEDFVRAIDKNNELSQKQIAIENDRLTRFKEYFPDTDVETTINPEGSTYKDSQYDRVHRADMQVQLLEDLKTTIAELDANETERQRFQQQLDAGDVDAANNIAACERKAAMLKEKISKVGEDGRETGLIQRLKDFGLKAEYVSRLDIDRAESYGDKNTRVDEILRDVRNDRKVAYADMAKTVLATLDAKGVVDANSSKYPASKLAAMKAEFRDALGGSSKDPKSGVSFDDDEEISEEDAEKARQAVKAYVKYVKDDIQLTQDRIEEYESAIDFRNETKEEITRQQELARTSQEEADRLRTTPVSEDQRQEWLDEEVQVGEGDNARRVVAKEQIAADAELEAQAEAATKYANRGTNRFTKFWRNVGFFFRHGFRTRTKMIAKEAESLKEAKIEEKTGEYIADRKDQLVSVAQEKANRARGSLNAIETISRNTRNDASIHEAAHNAAANITDETMLTGPEDSRVQRGIQTTAQDLSNMGYDMALQQWRNGEMSQADFDRILKEHIENPERKDRYAKPDETKGYTKTPQYRNNEAPAREDRD